MPYNLSTSHRLPPFYKTFKNLGPKNFATLPLNGFRKQSGTSSSGRAPSTCQTTNLSHCAY